MTLQKEPGKSHEPMRPRLITLDLAAGYNLPAETGGSVDWTNAATQLPSRQLNKYLDKPQGVISVVSNDIRVPRGLWKAHMCVEVSNNSAVASACSFAITNLGGTTVHKEWGDIQFPPLIGRMTLMFEVLIKVTSATDFISFRGARRTGGLTQTVQPAYIGFIQKVANHGEALEV